MTGLYDNIHNLQNEKHTFLYRAPKLQLRLLNIRLMAGSYSRTLGGVSAETARKIAQLTKGICFCFQVLGYYAFQEDGRLSKSNHSCPAVS